MNKQVFIKVWPNQTATLFTDSGTVLWTFSSLAAARQACDEWNLDIYTDAENFAEDLSCANCSVS